MQHTPIFMARTYFNETRKKHYNGKVIADVCEENINSKCFYWDLKETQTFKAYQTESYKYCIIPVKIEQKCFLLLSTR